MSTKLELAQQLRQELGVTGNADTPTSTVGQIGTLKKICDCLTEAEYFVSTLWNDWNFLWKQHAPSTTTDSVIDAPSDIGTYDKESFYFTIVDEEPLTFVTYKEYRSDYRDSEDGTPCIFTIRPDKKIILEPPQDATGTLVCDYWHSPVKMDGDSATPTIPERFERVFLEYAKYMFAVQFKDMELEQQSLALYKAALLKLESAELPDREDGNSQAFQGRITVE